MFGFLVKKAFFDMWDNMFRVILLNLGFLAVFAIFFLLAPLVTSVPVLFFIILGIGIVALAMYTSAASRLASAIADYQQPGFAEFWGYVKEGIGSTLLAALIVGVYAFVISVAFRFYGGISSLAGPLAIALLFWVTVAVVLAGQYFFPIQSRLDKSFRKIARKSFLVLFDNTGFSIALFIGGIVIVALSAFTAFLLPGLATLLLWWNVGLKLRLYKYDWLEQNPGASRRHVPWDALLIDDRERVGKRTLKGMIFPWKE